MPAWIKNLAGSGHALNDQAGTELFDRRLGKKQFLNRSRIGHYGAFVIKDPAHVLREHGLQVTAQRLAVMRAVARRPHATVDEVADEVRGEIGVISKQAVYDALHVLAQKGVVRRIQPAGSPARYEDRVNDNHHHVICRHCGLTADVDCAMGTAPCLNAADDRGFRIDEAEVIFWGTCPACLSRA